MKSFIRIFQDVNTPCGVGKVINVDTPFNGLYFSYDQTQCTIWFGPNGSTKWISRQYSLKQIEEWNENLERDNKINDILE